MGENKGKSQQTSWGAELLLLLLHKINYQGMAHEILVACKGFCSGNPTGSFHCGHLTKLKGSVLLWRPQQSILLLRWIFIRKSWRLPFRKDFLFCFVFHWPTLLHNIVMASYIYPRSCHTPAWLDKPGLLSLPEMKKMLDCAAWRSLHKEGETCSGEGKQNSRLSITLLSKICNLIAQKCHWLEGSHLLLRVFKVC